MSTTNSGEIYFDFRFKNNFMATFEPNFLILSNYYEFYMYSELTSFYIKDDLFIRSSGSFFLVG